MGRSRNKVYEPTHPHFLTCTILHWLSIFTNQESVRIVIGSLTHLQKSDNFLSFHNTSTSYSESYNDQSS